MISGRYFASSVFDSATASPTGSAANVSAVSLWPQRTHQKLPGTHWFKHKCRQVAKTLSLRRLIWACAGKLKVINANESQMRNADSRLPSVKPRVRGRVKLSDIEGLVWRGCQLAERLVKEELPARLVVALQKASFFYTQFLIFDTTFFVFDTQFLVLNTKFMISTHPD